MPTAVKTYDAKIDSKKRITLRNAMYEYYHVEEYDDGRIVLEPRELVPPFQISDLRKEPCYDGSGNEQFEERHSIQGG